MNITSSISTNGYIPTSMWGQDVIQGQVYSSTPQIYMRVRIKGTPLLQHLKVSLISAIISDYIPFNTRGKVLPETKWYTLFIPACR